MYPATVLDNRDPDGLARVLVRVPGVTDAGGVCTVQCDTLTATSVISASYSPGAGNIW